MKYHNNSLHNMQIIYYFHNTAQQYKVKQINIDGYNKYFITQKFNSLIIDIINNDKIINLISYSILPFIIKLKKIGYIKIIIYIKFINPKKQYHILRLKFNPILHKIIINDYKTLKIPSSIITRLFYKQLGIPINYLNFNNAITHIRNWYIDKGFYWIKINWTYSKNTSENLIAVNIYEGEIDKIFVHCDNAIISKQIITLNYIIIKYLKLYKKNILNQYNVEKGIQQLQKKYAIYNLKYSIKYDDIYNKLIIIIKYKLLNLHYYSSYKSFLYKYNHNNIDSIIKPVNIINNIFIYLYKTYILCNYININIFISKTINNNLYHLNIIYPYLHLYKRFIIHNITSIKYNNHLQNSKDKIFINSLYAISTKKTRVNRFISNYIYIEDKKFNPSNIYQYITYNKYQIAKKYISIKYNYIFQKTLIRHTYKYEITHHILNIMYSFYQLNNLIYKQLLFNCIYSIIPYIIKINYINYSHITYINKIIYFQYTQSIAIFKIHIFQNNINLFIRYCINLQKYFQIPLYLINKFSEYINNYDRRCPINFIKIIYTIQLSQYYSLYAFLCYIPYNIYYTNIFSLHNCNVSGIGIKFNFKIIIKQIPILNLEYSINSRKQIYFHIYTT